MYRKETTIPIRDCMTKAPQTIDLESPISKGLDVMREKKIRHLPVQYGHQLVGTVSERVLKAAALSKWGDQFTISDVMIPDPFVVGVDTSVLEVIDRMIEEKLDSAIVSNTRGEAIGIFTTIDALKLLRNAKERFT